MHRHLFDLYLDSQDGAGIYWAKYCCGGNFFLFLTDIGDLNNVARLECKRRCDIEKKVTKPIFGVIVLFLRV